ncbi:MAG: rhodanese-like domain-containing protein [Syntrophomonas sp.]|nr:rhodanese-like domain-containing protein [Syntrophomonas sp.]
MAGAISLPAQSIAEKNTQNPAIEYKKITAKEAKSRIDSGEQIIIVDVRTEAEYISEHIPNAVLIPNETIANSMPALLPALDAEILIYCRSGNRSAQAAKKLIAIGYTNVYDFGGIANWPYDKVKGN